MARARPPSSPSPLPPSLFKPRFSACHFFCFTANETTDSHRGRFIGGGSCVRHVKWKTGRFSGTNCRLTSPRSLARARSRNRERLERPPRKIVSFKFAPQSGIDRKSFSAPCCSTVHTNGRGRTDGRATLTILSFFTRSCCIDVFMSTHLKRLLQPLRCRVGGKPCIRVHVCSSCAHV